MGGNLKTGLKRRARPDPMRQYDALPPVLRAWLARAALPWSPQSALRLWQRALAEARGCPEAARARLDRAEAAMLARDAAAVWGRGHPGQRHAGRGDPA